MVTSRLRHHCRRHHMAKDQGPMGSKDPMVVRGKEETAMDSRDLTVARDREEEEQVEEVAAAAAAMEDGVKVGTTGS